MVSPGETLCVQERCIDIVRFMSVVKPAADLPGFWVNVIKSPRVFYQLGLIPELSNGTCPLAMEDLIVQKGRWDHERKPLWLQEPETGWSIQ